METEYRGPDSRRVQQMFAGIAHRYDFLNHFLSASIDRRWRTATVRKVLELTSPSPPRVCLDLCSGTGDLALELHRQLACEVIASDFCHPMLVLAAPKFAARRIRNVEADALRLPFENDLFDALTIGFGLRNLEDPARGLAEMYRVLGRGGVLVILEFSKPVVPVLREVFGFYFARVLPKLGAVISRDGNAYQYLHDSVRRFPAQQELLGLMRSAGFNNAGYKNLSGGIAAMHWGQK